MEVRLTSDTILTLLQVKLDSLAMDIDHDMPLSRTTVAQVLDYFRGLDEWIRQGGALPIVWDLRPTRIEDGTTTDAS